MRALGIELLDNVTDFLGVSADDLEGIRPDAHDRFLIRKLYDLHWILPHVDRAVVLQLARDIALSDADQFANWFPGYRRDPQGWTQRALIHLESGEACHASYREFVRLMVYGESSDFHEAFQSVAQLGWALWNE